MWLEVIQIKTFCQASKEKALEKGSLLELPNKGNIPDSLEVMERRDHDVDILIILYWNEYVEIQKSWIGLQLAKAFSKYGWVAHTTWSTTFQKARKGVKNHVE